MTFINYLYNVTSIVHTHYTHTSRDEIKDSNLPSKDGITKLSRPRFSKTLVLLLVKSKGLKFRPGLNIIEH